MNEDIAYIGLLDDDAIVLDTAALEIAALDHLDTDLHQYTAVLSELTEELIETGEHAVSPRERAAALSEVIAGKFGFAGDRNTYDDPANADLICVLDRRRGLPVSLSILYVAAARRLGWSADALNTPGHVLVSINSPTEPVLIDPFGGGMIISPEQLAMLLSRMMGREIVPASEHLQPMSNRAILVRLLMNQARRAEADGKSDRALVLYRRMTVIAPASAHAWWERARLELVGGDVSEARASLSAMLEVTREPATRAHIFAALDAISGATH